MRIAIIGAGAMGTNHARVAAGIPGAALAYVVDSDLERAKRLATRTGAQPTTRVEDVLGMVDAAVVAVPNDLHLEIGLLLIEAGTSVLVEKPLAVTVSDAKALVSAAERYGVTLMVGHVERFNPAVMELKRIVTRPLHISAVRISPYNARAQESVVLDLMIHDLDLLQSLVQEPVVEINAVGQTLDSATPDMACALLRYANGITADLTASRIGQYKIRELRITQPDAFVTVDLIRQDVTIHRVVHSEFSTESATTYRQSGVIEIPFLENSGEPLFLELTEFLRAVAEGSRPGVTGADGVEALELACRVERTIQGG